MKQIITTILLLIIAANAYAQTTPSYIPTNGLVAYYPFDDNANDISGNGNNGTVNGATSTTDRTGNSNKAYYFSSSGCGTYISANINTSTIQTGLSISIWLAKIGNGCLGPRILEFGNNPVQTDGPGVAQWGWDNSNAAGFGSTVTNGTSIYSPFTPKSNGVWTHLVYTNDGVNGKFYQDGTLINIIASNSNPILSGNVAFGRMNHPSFDAFNGKLDDIGIWNRALTQVEITALYNATTCLSTTSTTNTTICPNALPYTWNGKTLTASGTLKDTLTNAAGCDSIATLNLTVTAPPTPSTNNICIGSTLQLTNATSGGVWSSIAGRATVSNTGLVTGTSAGVAIIKYKLANGATTTYNITVNAKPNIPSIAYAVGAINPQLGTSSGNFCSNKTFGVVGVPSGGVFSSSSNSILTVNCSGVANTVATGNVTLTYTYTNAAGCSNSRSISGNVVACAARGINGAAKEIQETRNIFFIYPNPAKSLININIETLFGAGTIAITDLYGKQLKTQSLSLGTNTIDISRLSRGIYFVSVITNEGKTTKKLVVE